MEGFEAIPYWDYGQWTVGFGTRCPDEHLARYQKEGIPYEEAHELMREHVAIFEGYVNTFMNNNDLQLSQHQFDALVSLVYNLGPAVLYDYESDLMHAILNGAGGN
jgi:lysozyme